MGKPGRLLFLPAFEAYNEKTAVGGNLGMGNEKR